MWLGCEWRHARKRGAENFGDFWKKAVSWDLMLDEASWHLNLGEASWFLDLGEASPAGDYGMHRAFIGSVSWDSDSGPRVPPGNWLKNKVETVSIVKICVSLSVVRKPKVKKKLINISYLNYRESSVFRDFYASEHFTYPYICIVVSWIYNHRMITQWKWCRFLNRMQVFMGKCHMGRMQDRRHVYRDCIGVWKII